MLFHFEMRQNFGNYSNEVYKSLLKSFNYCNGCNQWVLFQSIFYFCGSCSRVGDIYKQKQFKIVTHILIMGCLIGLHISISTWGKILVSVTMGCTNAFVIKTNTVHLIHRIADEQTDRHTAMELYNNVKATIAKLFSECGWYFLSFFPICTMKFEEDYLLI